MKIIVVGYGGYVGASLVQYIHEHFSESTNLVGIDAGYFLSQQDDSFVAPERFLNTIHLKDARDLSGEDFVGADAVIYLAALSNDPMGDRFVNLTDRVNRQSALECAELARSQGASAFIFASSASVYGAGSDAPRAENAPTGPLTAYAKSKIQAEQGFFGVATSDFKIFSLRFATACGWSSRIRLDVVLNDFVASALSKGKIDVLSDGLPWRPLISVSEMSRAIVWCIENSNGVNEDHTVLNVGHNSWNYQIRDLAHSVADTLGGVAVTVNQAASSDARSYRVDFSRWEELAPVSTPSLESTIIELQTHLTQLEDLTEFRSGARIRLNHLRELQTCAQLDEDLRWMSRAHS